MKNCRIIIHKTGRNWSGVQGKGQKKKLGQTDKPADQFVTGGFMMGNAIKAYLFCRKVDLRKFSVSKARRPLQPTRLAPVKQRALHRYGSKFCGSINISSKQLIVVKKFYLYDVFWNIDEYLNYRKK